MTSVLVPYAQLDSILEEFTDATLWLVVMNPGIDEENVEKDESLVLRAVLPKEDPATADLSTLSILIQINRGSGWETIYEDGTFAAPWDVSSTVTDSGGGSLYTYREVACIPGEDVFPDSSTVQVRIAATRELPTEGWAEFSWGTGGWGTGNLGGVAEASESFSFTILDETAPQALLVEAIGRQTIRVTYSESMAPLTEDGEASVVSTVPAASWPASSSLPWEFQVVVNGVQQTVSIDDTMVSGTDVLPEEVSFSLSALLEGVTAEDDGSLVTLSTSLSGDNATLQVVGGNGATILGFPDLEAVGAYKGVLDAANYSVTRHNVYPNPAVNLEIESAAFEEDSTSVVELTTQWPMTHNAPYKLRIDGDITDTSGNVIDSTTLVHDFIGFKPDWPDRRDTEITLPQVIWDHDEDQVMRAIVNIWQEYLDQTVDDYDELWNYFSADDIPAELLELALADMGNPFDWAELDLDESEKRKLLDLLPEIYASKGLGPGIESVVYLLLTVPVQVEPHIENGWRLGLDTLGDSDPAMVRCANPGPYDLTGGGSLTVEVNEGDEQTIVLDEDDFDDPSVATTLEVVAIIDAQLDGGGAEPSDDGSGPKMIIYSEYYGPGGAIQVTGGTANTEFGFDTSLHSSSGGCRLAPGDPKSLRTFDLVYGDVIPSEEQIILIRRIAKYMKAASEFVGTIRPTKVYEASDRWKLGGSTLGVDTVIG